VTSELRVLSARTAGKVKGERFCRGRNLGFHEAQALGLVKGVSGNFAAGETLSLQIVHKTPFSLTFHLSQPSREIISFDVHDLDQIVKRIPSKKPGTKW
jgi:hypothetical protein